MLIIAIIKQRWKMAKMKIIFLLNDAATVAAAAATVAAVAFVAVVAR